MFAEDQLCNSAFSWFTNLPSRSRSHKPL